MFFYEIGPMLNKFTDVWSVEDGNIWNNINVNFSICMVRNDKNLKQKKRLVKANHKSDKIFLAPGTMTLQPDQLSNYSQWTLVWYVY